MKKSILTLLSLSCGVVAQAQTISWNVDSYGTISGAEVAGVVPAANWNDTYLENGDAINAYGSPTPVNNLTDNSGAATTLNIAYQAYNFYSIQGSAPGPDTDGTYNRNLLNGYLNAGPATWGPPVTSSSITLSQIPYSQYDIYVYFSSDTAGRAGNITDGSTTFDYTTIGGAEVSGASALFVQTTDTTGLNPNADYAVFSGETASSLTLTASALSGNDQWLGIAGFQVVAVPEPGAFGFAAAGMGLFTLVRRFKLRS